MSTTKIKISHINNLTDARYFAAAGVDYLGFCCNPSVEEYCGVSKIQEIKQWVEGPEFVLEFDGWQEDGEVRQLLNTELGTAAHFGTFANYLDPFNVKVFKDFLMENVEDGDYTYVEYPVIKSDRSLSSLSDVEIDNILHFATGKYKFLDFPIDTEDIRLFNSLFPGFGLILRGGVEEKIGFKSYDELDNIFEQLLQ